MITNAPISMNGHRAEVRTYNIFCLPVGFSGCAFWRYRMPMAKLLKIGTSLNINLADNADKNIRLQDIQEHVEKAQLISMQSPGYKDAVSLIKLYKSEGRKVVVDYDDYSFDLSPGNPRYQDLGIREAQVLGPNGETLFCWKDGENGFDLKMNIAKYEAFKECLSHCDMVTTTTEYLANKFREFSKNVVVCPNSIDFDRWKPLERPEHLKKHIRIGWFGGDSHYEDLRVFKTLFPRLLAKYSNLRFVIQGSPVPEWAPIFNQLPEGCLEWHGWADLRFYTIFLAARHFDIGLCPLEDSEFNRCKSNIKVLEFAALKVPTVSQNMPPYSNYIKDGVTGFVAGTEDEWFDKLSILIENEQLRLDMGQAAYTDAYNNYNLDVNCKNWEQAFINCIERDERS